MDYGMKDQNPIDNVLFYCKADPSKAVKISKEQVVFYFPQMAFWKWSSLQLAMEAIAVLRGSSCSSCGKVVESMSLQVLGVCHKMSTVIWSPDIHYIWSV